MRTNPVHIYVVPEPAVVAELIENTIDDLAFLDTDEIAARRAIKLAIETGKPLAPGSYESYKLATLLHSRLSDWAVEEHSVDFELSVFKDTPKTALGKITSVLGPDVARTFPFALLDTLSIYLRGAAHNQVVVIDERALRLPEVQE